MAKRGRPVKPDAKRDSVNVRLSSWENSMLDKLSKLTGKTRTEVMVDSMKREFDRVNQSDAIED